MACEWNEIESQPPTKAHTEKKKVKLSWKEIDSPWCLWNFIYLIQAFAHKTEKKKMIYRIPHEIPFKAFHFRGQRYTHIFSTPMEYHRKVMWSVLRRCIICVCAVKNLRRILGCVCVCKSKHSTSGESKWQYNDIEYDWECFFAQHAAYKDVNFLKQHQRPFQ